MSKYFFRIKLLFVVVTLFALLGACQDHSENDNNNKNEKIEEANENTNEDENSGKPESEKKKPSKSDNLLKLRIIFITTSEACKCTMARCKKGEEALNKSLELFEGVPPVEKIGFAKETDKARELAKKHGGTILPVLLLLDDKEELLEILQGEFEQKAVDEIFSKHLKKKEAKE